MKIALSGYAGVGKSSLTEHAKNNNKEYFIATESAREVHETESYFDYKDNSGRFFQKSIMDNEFVKIKMVLLNEIKDAVFDRSIIDNLVFAELTYGEKSINYSAIQSHIDKLRKEYDVDYIYDKSVLIKISRDHDFLKNILQDDLRRSTTSSDIDNFILQGQNWEKRYIKILNKLEGVTKSFDIIEHFTKNENFIPYFKNILKIK
jgi:deoxyadenosine/deoxycytidine kinase